MHRFVYAPWRNHDEEWSMEQRHNKKNVPCIYETNFKIKIIYASYAVIYNMYDICYNEQKKISHDKVRQQRATNKRESSEKHTHTYRQITKQ